MQLTASIPKVLGGEPFIARIAEPDSKHYKNEVLLVRGAEPVSTNGFRCVLRIGKPRPNEIPIPPVLEYLRPGDIVRVNPRAGEVRVLYRRNSPHNTLFFTERCNSRCLMCSQPPREIEDGYLGEEILEAIPLMARDTSALCITGGEPTLLGKKLIDVISKFVYLTGDMLARWGNHIPAITADVDKLS